MGIDVEGREIKLSNLDKVFYPETEFTKGQVIAYYSEVSEYLLPHLKNRPVTLKRFPDGVSGKFFYEKNAPRYTPDWVERFSVPSRTRGSDIHYILINDLPTLVWLANFANLEIHPFLHKTPEIERPTAMVFDLDPGEGSDVLTCARAALLLRDLFSELELQSFAKVSGSKGIQVYVPLNGTLTYDVVRPFANAVAELMEQRHPDFIVSRMAKELRFGKVLIDWSQNSDFKTTVSVYSLRAKPDGPFVSLPLDWKDLAKALKARKASQLYFTPAEALKRIKRTGDLFAPVLSLKQNLPPEILAAVPTAALTAEGPLKAYTKKRDFSKTREPKPVLPRASARESQWRFVIQKHAASHLHYDFRLEMNGVLKSWAVPKDPPFALNVNRLAMATEDHPLDYLDFEGIIPKGQYGGGTVMVWDIGTYEVIEGNYYKGHLNVYLEGKKLQGEWSLNRSSDDEGKKWYLRKSGVGAEQISPKVENQSALSGRSMEAIAAAPEREWQSNRTADKKLHPPEGATKRTGPGQPGRSKSRMPRQKA